MQNGLGCRDIPVSFRVNRDQSWTHAITPQIANAIFNGRRGWGGIPPPLPKLMGRYFRENSDLCPQT